MIGVFQWSVWQGHPINPKKKHIISGHIGKVHDVWCMWLWMHEFFFQHRVPSSFPPSFLPHFSTMSDPQQHDRQVISPLFPHFSAISDQQSQQDEERHEPELQKCDGQVVQPPLVLTPEDVAYLEIAKIAVQFIVLVLKYCMAQRTSRIPYHTSILSRQGWVNELLIGHPRHIRVELGVEWDTFIFLVKAMQTLGLQSSHHVLIEEQLAIFLYTAVTGLTSNHIGECFQHSTGTITK